MHGKVVTDVLRFSEPPIVVPDQGFGLATESSADFESASCDGIFVSALPSLLVHALLNAASAFSARAAPMRVRVCAHAPGALCRPAMHAAVLQAVT